MSVAGPARVHLMTCQRCGVEWEYVKPNPRGGRMPQFCEPCKPMAAAEQMRRWNRVNAEKIRASKTKWRLANPALMAAARAEWEKANPERRREYRRTRKRMDPIANRAYVRARQARRKNQTIVPFTAEQVRQRLAYFGGRCWMCGGEAEVIDHVKPLSKGGAHAVCNMRPACDNCNTRKGARWPFPTSPSSSRGGMAVLIESALFGGPSANTGPSTPNGP